MDWLKNNYEKAILLFISIVVVILALLYINRINNFKKKYSEKSYTKKSKIDHTYIDELTLARNVLDSKNLWKKKNSALSDSGLSLFVGPLLLDIDGKKNLVSAGKPIHIDKEPKYYEYNNEWFFINKLDILDKQILNKDSDGDGYTNREEYHAKTNPQNKSNHPPIISRLYFVAVEKEDYILKFTAYNAPDIGINRVKPNSKSKLSLRVGDKFFTDERFTIKNYVKKTKIHPSLGIKVNASELTIYDNLKDKDFFLVFKEKKNIPTYTAVFRFLLKDDVQIKRKLGETFDLQTTNDNNIYYVEKITDNEVHLSYISKSDSVDLSSPDKKSLVLILNPNPPIPMNIQSSF